MRLPVFVALAMAVSAALLTANPPDAKEDLHSDVPKVRAKAAEDLGKDRDSQNIPLLRGLLKDPDRQVRAEAVAAIVNIGTQDSLAPLMEATRDSEPSIQMLAVDGLVNFYYPGYVQTGWTAALKKFGSSVKSRFTETNTLVIDPYIKVSPDVVQALGRVATGGSSMDSRALAARALGILRARDAVPQLIEALRSKDSEVILESLRALEKIGDKSAGPQFAFLLRDLSEPVQVAAVDATGQLQNREAMPVLRELVKTSKKANVRRAALVALAKMPDPADKTLYYTYLADKDRYLRAAAAEGIGRCGDASDVDRLKKAFEAEKSESPRLSMAFALVHLGDLSYIPYLLDALNSTFHRGEARPFLIELARQPQVLAQLYKPLQEGSNDQKKNLAEVVAISGNAQSLPYLDQLSHDPNSEVAQEAIRAAKILRARL
ncbi:MAG TPA: HEAT repeat domain-containing protein [Bryobacterales bacterium]|jgi:HEAT repeat protein|nr:HEAT repeat domain-containing protein [Bryobacterales bacterium]